MCLFATHATLPTHVHNDPGNVVLTAMVGDSFQDAIFYGGDWDVTEIIAALGSLQSMELAAALDELFDLRDEVEEDDPGLVD